MDNENTPNTTTPPEEIQADQPSLQENDQSNDTFFSNLIKNKRLVLFFIGGLVLLIIIFIAANPLMFGSSNTNQTPTPTQGAAPSGALLPTDTLPTNGQIPPIPQQIRQTLF